MTSLGELHQPASQKGECLISTERLVVHIERGYSISRNAKRLHEFAPCREDVADALHAGLVREDVGVRKVVKKPVGFCRQVLTSKGEVVHHAPELLMASTCAGALPALPDAGDQLSKCLLLCLGIAGLSLLLSTSLRPPPSWSSAAPESSRPSSLGAHATAPDGALT